MRNWAACKPCTRQKPGAIRSGLANNYLRVLPRRKEIVTNGSADPLLENVPRAWWTNLALNMHAAYACYSREVSEEERGRITGDGGEAVADNRKRLEEAGNRLSVDMNAFFCIVVYSDVCEGDTGILISADTWAGVAGNLHSVTEGKRSAIYANASTYCGVRHGQAVVLDLVRSIHGELTQADDIDTDGVVVLDDRDIRGAVWKGAISVERGGARTNLKANVTVGADNIAAEELGGSGIENIDAFAISLK